MAGNERGGGRWLRNVAVVVLILSLAWGVDGKKKKKKKGKEPKGGSEGKVVSLNLDNYSQSIKKTKLAMLEFYAPWCGPCKELAPKYEELAEKVAGRALIAKVDAVEEADLKEEFDVTGFPTLFLFKDGDTRKPIKYDGPHEVGDMLDFITTSERKMLTVFHKFAEVEEFVRPKELRVVHILATFEDGSPAATAFEKASKAFFQKFVFARVSPSAEGLPEGLSKPGIRVFTNSKNEVDFGDIEVLEAAPGVGTTGLNKFEVWVEGQTIPPPTRLASSIIELMRAQKGKLPIIQIFVNASIADDVKDVTRVAPRVAEEFKDIAKYMIFDAEKSKEIDQHYGIGLSSGLPKFYVVNKDTGEKYISNDTMRLTETSLTRFTREFVEGKLKPAIKSQPVAEAITENGLTTVVGDTFARVVEHNAFKDVVINFCAPYNGHCMAMDVIYNALAKDLEDVDTIVIGKFDTASNDWLNKGKFPVMDVPTLFIIPAQPNPGFPRIPPQKYEGEKNYVDIKKWVRKFASYPIPTNA